LVFLAIVVLAIIYLGHFKQLYIWNVQGGPKSKPLPNYQKNVLNRIKSAIEIRFLRQIKK